MSHQVCVAAQLHFGRLLDVGRTISTPTRLQLDVAHNPAFIDFLTRELQTC